MQVHTDLDKLPEFRRAVITIGSFDGVHSGHRHILKQLAETADQVDGESVVITFEPHPRIVLQKQPEAFRLLSTPSEKVELLRAAGIDHVVFAPFTPAFSQLSARAYVEEFLLPLFKPSVVVIGYDHRFGAQREGNIDFLRAYKDAFGFQIVEIPAQQVDTVAVSSTKIRRALENGEPVAANRLLGYAYRFSGRVVKGNRIGRQIGFPTANLEVNDPYKLIPAPGIYAARVELQGEQYDAMLYIGTRPTLSSESPEPRIEVNILDFERDIYGMELQILVYAFIREDKQLEDLDQLRQQIGQDRDVIRAELKKWRKSESAERLQNVAVVILNYNTRDHLATFLPSVVQHSGGARIILADNGSPDDSVEYVMAHFPEVEILPLPRNYGFAQGYNEALKQVQADIFVILNSDVEVSPGWIAPAIRAMAANPGIAVVQPKILSWRQKDRFEYAGAAGGWIDFLGYPFCRGRIFSHQETDEGQYDAPQSCFWAAGAAFFIRAELYQRFGGFDGDYFAHNEEIDLCWRLKRAGYEVVCLPESVVYHLGGGTLEYEKPRKVLLNFRNSLYTLVKNERAAKLLWLIPARLLLDGLAGLMFAVQRKPASVLALIQAHIQFYGALPVLLRKRREIAAMIRNLSVGQRENPAGRYKGSIVWQYYIRRIKRFDRLSGKRLTP